MSAAPEIKKFTELRKVVLDYTPGINTKSYPDHVKCPDKLYIGLFGKTGCGKTSLINSLKFATLGELRQSQWHQAAGQDKAGGHTMFRRLADITKNIFVIDNRGADLNTTEAIEELHAQLDGKRGYTHKVEWQIGNAYHDDRNLSTGHPINCVVLVFSAVHAINEKTKEIDMTDAIEMRRAIAFLETHQGCFPVAVITHVDVAEKKVVDNLKSILQATGISDIFEVANVTTTKKRLETSYQHVLLSMLERCMTDGDETIVFKHYKREEERRAKEKNKSSCTIL